MNSAATIDTTSAVTRAMKLLAVALDPAARDGEAETSAVMFARECRRKAVLLPDLVKSLAIVPPTKTIPVNDDPPACRIRMPYGKFGGRPLGWIAEHNPSYIAWGIDNLTNNPEIIAAMLVVAEYYGIGPFKVSE